MKEINLANILITKRREKGITQDELAQYMGVSKASVSKWETGQNYPDITFLPQLAMYFNISIDELIGYSPQMTKEDIRKLYHTLASQFASASFEDTLAECRSIIKKHYSCFPLLFQMVTLFINHHTLAKTPEERETILREASGLCIRIKTESDDVWLSKEAVFMQAYCCMALNEPQSALDLLGETIRPDMQEKVLISQAYQLMGNTEKAKEVTQITVYQHVMSLLDSMINYLHLSADNLDKGEEILSRAISLANIYRMEELNPNSVVSLYIVGANMYCVNGCFEKAMDMLNEYADVCVKNFFPCTLHGDSFFDSLDDWLSDLDLGTAAPRSEKLIKDSMLQIIVTNPAFSSLIENPRYKSIIKKLENFIGEK